MKLYIFRSLKYIVRMAVIIAVLIGVLWATGTLDTGGDSVLAVLFLSWRGVVLIGLIVIFAMMYPNISFTTLSVPGDTRANRDQIMEAFAAYSYHLVKEEDGKMIFRSRKVLKRVMWQFDDAVTVWQNADNIEIEGLKKIISRVRLRLDAYINH